MEKRQLECGHQAHVPQGRSGTWCPVCNDIRLLHEQESTRADERESVGTSA